MNANNYDLKSVVSRSQIAGRTEFNLAHFLYSRPMNYILVLLIFSACATVSAEPLKSMPPLHTDSGEYDNACSTKELIRLHEDLIIVTVNKNPDDAWQVTKAILCGLEDDGAATAIINLHSPKKILFSSQNAGSKEVIRELREPDEELLAQQKAWGTNITSELSSNLRLSYLVNAGCTRGVVLRFNGKRWLIVEFGYVCEADFIDGVSKGC